MKRAAPYLLAALALAVLGAVAAAVISAQRPPEGPVAVIWDKQACARCKMHVTDPRFAVQLHEESGEVLFFDDPGCFFAYEAAARPRVHAVYFRHLREDRWLPLAAVAFAPVDASPMDYGLGAVDPGEPGAAPLEEARARALAREAGGGR